MGYFTNYPFHVFLVLACEFCERFSYYGMRAILVMYLLSGLGFSDSSATSIYHAFVVLCYISPLFGAMIADGWLGKYRTILYISILYAFGNIFMTLSAIQFNDYYIQSLMFIGLVVIGFGTGGIKPCVSSFGGDQFKDGQTRQKESFFSLFYLIINLGSMVSTLLIPYLRGNVYCFGDHCYALCFGIPAALMVVSIILFVSGTKWYTKHPAGDSILKKFFGCIGLGLSRKCSCSKTDDEMKKDHWLDMASPDYDQAFIEDVKDVMRVAWLFIPLPVFWALFDMQGSKWIIQAQQMNGNFENATVYPDMIHFLNPLLVVFLVPLLEYAVYPCLTKLRIPNRPLQRMAMGMVLATVSFLITGFIQMAINAEQPAIIGDGMTKFQIINTQSSILDVKYGMIGEEMDTFAANGYPVLQDYEYRPHGSYKFSFNYDSQDIESTCVFNAKKAYQVFIAIDGTSRSINCHEQVVLTKTPKGESLVRVFNSLSDPIKLTLKNDKTDDITFESINTNEVSDSAYLIDSPFTAFIIEGQGVEKELPEKVESFNGAVYIMYTTRELSGEVVLRQLREQKPWSINIFLQTPQYFVMALAETLFSVTGLSFAYTQAPQTMKSILTAIWLLTVSVGNIVIIIVQAVSTDINPAFEFFLYTILMAITTVIFCIMTLFYTYVTPRGEIEECKYIDLDEEVVKIAEKITEDHPDFSTSF